MTNIYLMRHGKSYANKNRIYGTDPPLCTEGVAQALGAAATLGVTPDVVFSSTMVRAIQTARLAFPDKYKEKKLKEFDEVNSGILEGQKIDAEITRILIANPLLLAEKYSGDNVWERAERAMTKMIRIAKKISG